MKGAQFVIDERGTKTAVVIDLKQYPELWEDFYDIALAQTRKKEPRESLASLKKRLKKVERPDLMDSYAVVFARSARKELESLNYANNF